MDSSTGKVETSPVQVTTPKRAPGIGRGRARKGTGMANSPAASLLTGGKDLGKASSPASKATSLSNVPASSTTTTTNRNAMADVGVDSGGKAAADNDRGFSGEPTLSLVEATEELHRVKMENRLLVDRLDQVTSQLASVDDVIIANLQQENHSLRRRKDLTNAEDEAKKAESSVAALIKAVVKRADVRKAAAKVEALSRVVTKANSSTHRLLVSLTRKVSTLQSVLIDEQEERERRDIFVASPTCMAMPAVADLQAKDDSQQLQAKGYDSQQLQAKGMAEVREAIEKLRLSYEAKEEEDEDDLLAVKACILEIKNNVKVLLSDVEDLKAAANSQDIIDNGKGGGKSERPVVVTRAHLNTSATDGGDDDAALAMSNLQGGLEALTNKQEEMHNYLYGQYYEFGAAVRQLMDSLALNMGNLRANLLRDAANNTTKLTACLESQTAKIKETATKCADELKDFQVAGFQETQAVGRQVARLQQTMMIDGGQQGAIGEEGGGDSAGGGVVKYESGDVIVGDAAGATNDIIIGEDQSSEIFRLSSVNSRLMSGLDSANARADALMLENAQLHAQLTDLKKKNVVTMTSSSSSSVLPVTSSSSQVQKKPRFHPLVVTDPQYPGSQYSVPIGGGFHHPMLEDNSSNNNNNDNGNGAKIDELTKENSRLQKTVDTVQASNKELKKLIEQISAVNSEVNGAYMQLLEEYKR